MNVVLKSGVALAFAVLPANIGAKAADAAAVEGEAHAPGDSKAIPLYGEATPGSASDEIESRFMGRETILRNITYPTLTPVLPDPAKANGTAVIVAPGGGFLFLAMQNEGWRVAQALANRGIAAFVLKYRLNPTPRDDAAFMTFVDAVMGRPSAKDAGPSEISDPPATKDALAALNLVREHAAEWHVDPTRVGMIGFSAGAMTAMNAVLEASADDDQKTHGPDFIGYIYGPMDQANIPADAPPMFAALAMDDPLFGGGDWSLASAWHDAKRPVELHVYQSGGHGFGLGRPGTTTTMMMDQFLAWMDMRGLLKAKERP
jgi:acetyl esterase/lipase